VAEAGGPGSDRRTGVEREPVAGGTVLAGGATVRFGRAVRARIPALNHLIALPRVPPPLVARP
jgi:hypothetical protein